MSVNQNRINFTWQSTTGNLYAITINGTSLTAKNIVGRKTTDAGSWTAKSNIHDDVNSDDMHLSRLYYDAIITGDQTLADVLA